MVNFEVMFGLVRCFPEKNLIVQVTISRFGFAATLIFQFYRERACNSVFNLVRLKCILQLPAGIFLRMPFIDTRVLSLCIPVQH